jgi:hypothetical protein
MKVRNLLLAAVAVLATSLPARAEIILGFRTMLPSEAPPAQGLGINGLDIPDNSDPFGGNINSLGNPTTGLTLNPGDSAYVQVTVRATATNVGPGQMAWGNLPNGTNNTQLVIWGVRLTISDPSVATNPFIFSPTLTENGENFSCQAPFLNAYPGQPFLGNFRDFAGLAGQSGISANNVTHVVNERVVFTFRILAVAPGTSNFSVSQIPQQSLWTLAGGQTLDAEIFNQPYVLPVTVVPEPSSIALAGLAVAGFGYRKLRRKTTTAV